ncbi:uncharacterized protein DUF1612 [Sinorhizobium americanum]|uniref:Uncharacterized protein DUF1612 n=1 Tax=Sinorhizobium americanum TaxID=194963 RepID=A0A4R2AXZ1_9HYPH|nr:uncharacterized protein DUF1612 [Sinorhizobium americanum]
MNASRNGAPPHGDRWSATRVAGDRRPIDAWNELQVLQHAPWLGRMLAAALLRQAGLTTATHLATVNLGLKSIPVDRRRHRNRDTRLAAFTHGLLAAAELGLKEPD